MILIFANGGDTSISSYTVSVVLPYFDVHGT